MSSSIKGCLPPKVVFHQMFSSIEGRLPSKAVFHERLSSIEGHFPSKFIFHLWLKIETGLSFVFKVNLQSWNWFWYCQKEIQILQIILGQISWIRFLDPLYQKKSCYWSLNFKVLFSNLDSWLELLNFPIGSGLVWKKSLGNKFIINWCPWD